MHCCFVRNKIKIQYCTRFDSCNFPNRRNKTTQAYSHMIVYKIISFEQVLSNIIAIINVGYHVKLLYIIWFKLRNTICHEIIKKKLIQINSVKRTIRQLKCTIVIIILLISIIKLNQIIFYFKSVHRSRFYLNSVALSNTIKTTKKPKTVDVFKQ